MSGATLIDGENESSLQPLGAVEVALWVITSLGASHESTDSVVVSGPPEQLVGLVMNAWIGSPNGTQFCAS